MLAAQADAAQCVEASIALVNGVVHVWVRDPASFPSEAAVPLVAANLMVSIGGADAAGGKGAVLNDADKIEGLLLSVVRRTVQSTLVLPNMLSFPIPAPL